MSADSSTDKEIILLRGRTDSISSHNKQTNGNLSSSWSQLANQKPIIIWFVSTSIDKDAAYGNNKSYLF